jgi:hypothetical protein
MGVAIAELDPIVREGYLVYAGHPLGTGADGRVVTLDRDVLVVAVARAGEVWSVTLREMRVRPSLGPAA